MKKQSSCKVRRSCTEVENQGTATALLSAWIYSFARDTSLSNDDREISTLGGKKADVQIDTRQQQQLRPTTTHQAADSNGVGLPLKKVENSPGSPDYLFQLYWQIAGRDYTCTHVYYSSILILPNKSTIKRADILRYTFLKYTSELSTKVYSSIEVDTKVYLTSILRYTLIQGLILRYTELQY